MWEKLINWVRQKFCSAAGKTSPAEAKAAETETEVVAVEGQPDEVVVDPDAMDGITGALKSERHKKTSKTKTTAKSAEKFVEIRFGDETEENIKGGVEDKPQQRQPPSTNVSEQSDLTKTAASQNGRKVPLASLETTKNKPPLKLRSILKKESHISPTADDVVEGEKQPSLSREALQIAENKREISLPPENLQCADDSQRSDSSTATADGRKFQPNGGRNLDEFLYVKTESKQMLLSTTTASHRMILVHRQRTAGEAVHQPLADEQNLSVRSLTGQEESPQVTTTSSSSEMTQS